jgi:hypothetical protein
VKDKFVVGDDWDEPEVLKPVPFDARDLPPQQTLQVFRGATGQPVAVPAQIVAESERPYRCYMLHIQGLTWEKVAELESYPDWRAAKEDVKRYLDEGRALVEDFNRKQLLEREVARLDQVMTMAWPAAAKGSAPHMNIILGTIGARAKLLRLDQDVRDDDDTLKGRTVVAPADSDGFRAALAQVPGVEDRSGG